MAMEFLEGAFKLTNVVLAIVAGWFSLQIYQMSHKREQIPWKALAVALFFFMIQEILGALRAFGVYTSPFLTHIVPTIILAFLILALSLQIHYTLTRR